MGALALVHAGRVAAEGLAARTALGRCVELSLQRCGCPAPMVCADAVAACRRLAGAPSSRTDTYGERGGAAAVATASAAGMEAAGKAGIMTLRAVRATGAAEASGRLGQAGSLGASVPAAGAGAGAVGGDDSGATDDGAGELRWPPGALPAPSTLSLLPRPWGATCCGPVERALFAEASPAAAAHESLRGRVITPGRRFVAISPADGARRPNQVPQPSNAGANEEAMDGSTPLCHWAAEVMGRLSGGDGCIALQGAGSVLPGGGGSLVGLYRARQGPMVLDAGTVAALGAEVSAEVRTGGGSGGWARLQRAAREQSDSWGFAPSDGPVLFSDDGSRELQHSEHQLPSSLPSSASAAASASTPACAPSGVGATMPWAHASRTIGAMVQSAAQRQVWAERVLEATVRVSPRVRAPVPALIARGAARFGGAGRRTREGARETSVLSVPWDASGPPASSEFGCLGVSSGRACASAASAAAAWAEDVGGQPVSSYLPEGLVSRDPGHAIVRLAPATNGWALRRGVHWWTAGE